MTDADTAPPALGSPTLGSPATVTQRLRDGALASLVALVVDDLLARPVSGLLDPDFVADQVMTALDTASAGGRPEAWLREQIGQLRQQVPEGTLDDRVPTEVIEPLRQALGRPILWDRELVGRLVDHDAIRSIFADVLARALHGYGKKLTQLGRDNPVSQTARNIGLGGRFGRLRSLGEDLAKGLGAELEAQTEGRTREFVDHAMSAVLQQVADHVCDPAYADLYGRYRVHLVDVMLETELSVLADEVEKVDPDQLIATGAAVARSLSRREGTREEVIRAIHSVLDEVGDRSLRSFLAQTGIDEAQWRSGIEEQIVARGLDLVETPAFASWLAELLA